MMINLNPITNVVGALLCIISLFMFSCIPVSVLFGDGEGSIFLSSGMITLFSGIFLWIGDFGNDNSIKKREGYLIVSLGWLAIVFFSTIPYLLSGVIPDISNAFFETMSGLTTTGATILADIEVIPAGLLFWRSLTQWIGGMGIIVLTVAILPLLGIGGVELFVAEAPGPSSDKLHPRIKETAKRLWYIYVSLTLLLLIVLWLCGMTFFDSLNHALTTMATGGFSTKNSSIAHFESPAIEYVICFFMFLAGTNYTVIYWGLKSDFKKILKVDEFKAYVLIILIFALVVTISVYFLTNSSIEQSFRHALFQVISIITTAGFVTADYTSWSESLTLFFFILLFVGGCAGSTAGGIKIIRHLVFFKNTYLEFKRILHPRAIVPLKLNHQVVPPRIMTHVIIFLLIYLMTFLVGSVAVTATGVDLLTAIGAVATSISNVGPGIGSVGPSFHFGYLPDTTKWILSFLMLLGRLELFSILVLLTPYFWRLN